MRKLILKCTGPFRRGEIIDRPNRFILRVRMNSSIERVYFPNPGKLRTVVAPGREVLCEPATIKGRKTSFNAFAIRLSRFYVTVNSSFANTILSTAIDNGLLKEFRGHVIHSLERSIPNHGRIDFVLRDTKNRHVYVEVLHAR
jgi:sugar fermentation stimulation protein A